MASLDVGGNVIATQYQGTSYSTNTLLSTDGSSNIVASTSFIVPNTQGGTGANTSAFTGVAKVATGTWSASTIVNADISASAAITRSKLASGTANQVLINDGSGIVSSEAQLAVSRGGTGRNYTGLSDGNYASSITVSGGTPSFDSTPTRISTSNTNNTIVVRDGSGNFSANGINANSITLSPSGNRYLSVMKDSPVTGGQYDENIINFTTSSNTPVNVITYPTTGGNSYTFFIILTGARTAGSAVFGSYVSTTLNIRANNAGGVATSAIFNSISSNSGLSGIAYATLISGQDVIFRVTGPSGTNITWGGYYSVLKQQWT